MRITSTIRILALNWRCQRHPQAGGSELNLFEQARRWVQDGHQVTVFCSDPGREHAPQRDETVDGIRIIRRGGKFTMYLYAALFLLLRSKTFDRVLDIANGIPFFAPLFCRRPVTLLVHHVHDRQWFAEFPRPVSDLGWALEQRLVPRLYRKKPVIAVSPTTRDALVQTGVRPEQIRVVYNGVDLPELPAAEEPREPRIAYVGRLKRYKRLERLVQAVAELRERGSEVWLDIAGDGDARPEIQQVVRDLGLSERITVHGFVTDEEKAEILTRAAVFATPSMHEGWGLSVIEANAYGCPAIAYDVPGLRTSIRHGCTGLLAQDDAEFVRSIANVLDDPQARQSYSAAARKWASEFSWDRCAEETLEVLYSGRVEDGRSVEPEWVTADSVVL